ncbi:prickle planar cell polarity protein 3-like [Leptopilina boulardi]|nr:prickle planar cell polarity protein 3-like [Leptopilina boulardi]
MERCYCWQCIEERLRNREYDLLETPPNSPAEGGLEVDEGFYELSAGEDNEEPPPAFQTPPPGEGGTPIPESPNSWVTQMELPVVVIPRRRHHRHRHHRRHRRSFHYRHTHRHRHHLPTGGYILTTRTVVVRVTAVVTTTMAS